ncbi:MAG: PilN domain-containing protein [Minisyncoccia bacterium]
MFNLLPDSIKQEVQVEYQLRRTTVVLVFLIVIQISTLIFLFPSWILSNTKQSGLLLQLEKIEVSSLSSDAVKIQEKIKSINNELNLLNTSLEYPKFSTIVDKIISKKSSSIKLNSFSYSGGKTWVITIKGIALTRESLVSFVDSLKSDSQFKSVDLPVSNLAKNKNIDFSVILNISN